LHYGNIWSWRRKVTTKMSEQFIIGFLMASMMWIVLIALIYRNWKVHQEIMVNGHNRFVHVIENTNDFIYYAQVYPTVKFNYLSPSAEAFFGEGSNAGAYISAEVAFRDIHPDDYEVLFRKVKGEVDFSKGIIQRWKDKDGKYRWFEENATPIYENGVLVALQGVLRCIDEKIELQNQLEYRLYHDSLTELYNREYFEIVFEKYDQEANTPISIMICDLDELKYFNDHYGHKTGDLLIKETGWLLNQFSSEKIVVARLGGDEFAIILMETTMEEVEELLQQISIKIEKHNENASNIKISLSIGHAFAQHSKGNMEELFFQADNKMYMAKAERKRLLV
jgi:diguanylate cyclase (GGDEF)-like protein/PAS domain S-box-containing protein